MPAKALDPTTRDLYDLDFFEWTVRNAELIRAGRWDQADLEHVAQEIQNRGASEQRALASHLRVLVKHLLKWKFQPARRSQSWRAAIIVQRSDLARLLKDMPSLRKLLPKELLEIYFTAVVKAAAETRLPEDTFPATCPFSVDQILEPTFFPTEPLP